jgi:hypothetical protein
MPFLFVFTAKLLMPGLLARKWTASSSSGPGYLPVRSYKSLSTSRSSEGLHLLYVTYPAMFTKAGLYTFIYGERVGDAKAPPLLKFRSSNALIIATIAIAVFTVRIALLFLDNFSPKIGYFPLLVGSSRLTFCLDGPGRG